MTNIPEQNYPQPGYQEALERAATILQNGGTIENVDSSDRTIIHDHIVETRKRAARLHNSKKLPPETNVDDKYLEIYIPVRYEGTEVRPTAPDERRTTEAVPNTQANPPSRIAA